MLYSWYYYYIIGDADENDGNDIMVTIVPAVATAARLLFLTFSTLWSAGSSAHLCATFAVLDDVLSNVALLEDTLSQAKRHKSSLLYASLTNLGKASKWKKSF